MRLVWRFILPDGNPAFLAASAWRLQAPFNSTGVFSGVGIQDRRLYRLICHRNDSIQTKATITNRDIFTSRILPAIINAVSSTMTSATSADDKISRFRPPELTLPGKSCRLHHLSVCLPLFFSCRGASRLKSDAYPIVKKQAEQYVSLEKWLSSWASWKIMRGKNGASRRIFGGCHPVSMARQMGLPSRALRQSSARRRRLSQKNQSARVIFRHFSNISIRTNSRSSDRHTTPSARQWHR